MARILFFLQLVVALVVLPLCPGLDPRYSAFGLVFLGLLVLGPLGTVVAVYGFPAVGLALAHVWAVDPLGPRASTSVKVWTLASRTFPLSGLLGGLLAMVGILGTLDPGLPFPVQALTLVFFAMVWGFLGLLLGRVFQEVVTRLTVLPPAGGAALVPSVGAFFGLTPRETEAARAILEGLTYQGAGQKLGISATTVKSHLLKVYEKTGAGNKLELLRMVEAASARLHHSEDGTEANSALRSQQAPRRG